MMRASDNNPNKFDAEKLRLQAQRSVDGEAYVQIFRSDVCRVGVLAVVNESGKASYSVEVLVMAMNLGSGEVLSSLNSLVEAVKFLKNRGYTVNHQGDGWLAAWKRLNLRRINAELSLIMGMVRNGRMGKRRVDGGV